MSDVRWRLGWRSFCWEWEGWRWRSGLTVEFTVGMEFGDRQGWRDVYADAAGFLGRAVVEVCWK
jgi:hypothetical protein